MAAAPQGAERFVDSSDGTRLAVYLQGNPDGPTVVLVHGWPDSHVLWDGVVPLLTERFRIVRYDNRGVGGSSVPRRVSAYTMMRFADDFAAVIAALSPGQPVHVLAHDWGSTGVWEYLSRPGAADRVASFTSVSGPSADHLVAYISNGLRRPYRSRGFLRALSQTLRLSYMAVFSIPVAAPLLIRAALSNAQVRRSLVKGVPGGQIHHSDTLAKDAANSVKTYPANYFRSLSKAPQDHHHVDVPVQLVVNTEDPYVRPYGYDATSRWVSRLWRRDIKAGHWSPMSHPQVLAAAVHEIADLTEGKPPSRALRRAQVGRPREYCGDTLVSVTGAGSGIGRETALAFAREGAELVVSDINEAAVKDTAAQISARGGVAYPYVLDVADAAAVEAFAEQVCAEHGVPDIVVNNAGIG
ncbi:MAG: SDR family oxidoreductase, partial [Mycobacterium sp.]